MWRLMPFLFLLYIVAYLDRINVSFAVLQMRGQLGLSDRVIGRAQGMFFAGYFFFQLPSNLVLERFGVRRWIAGLMAIWGVISCLMIFIRGPISFYALRFLLGAAEAGGIPAAGKAIHQYLQPAERALGNAVNQAGVSLGAILAPPLATWIAVTRGWRSAFVVTGVLGLLWIPLWNFAARRAGAAPARKLDVRSGARMLADRRLWAFVAANALSMVGYSLWTNWTTQYLVDEHRLTLQGSVRYAWIPPVFAMAGGFAGGWLSHRFIRRGAPPIAARFRVCLAAAAVSLLTIAIPAAATPAWASAGISLSIFAVAAFSVNMYSLPLDAFGNTRAAFAVSILVASYGVIQFVISPAFGKLMDLHRWSSLTTTAALTPLAACAVLWYTRSVR